MSMRAHISTTRDNLCFAVRTHTFPLAHYSGRLWLAVALAVDPSDPSSMVSESHNLIEYGIS